MASPLDALAAQARAALAGHLPEVSADDAGENGRYTGTAADGTISAEVGLDGRVRSLSIDPKSLRRPLNDVTADVRTAINAALAARPGKPDFAPLARELAAMQEEARRNMSAITTAIAEATQRIRSARGDA